MSSRTLAYSRQFSRIVAAAMIVAILVAPVGNSFAGHRGFRNSAVGGISIDAFGVLGEARSDAKAVLLREMRADVKDAVGTMRAPTELRMISLRRIHEAIEDAQKNRLGRLPEEVQFLGGIQRLKYIFVYPEQNDIVLAGPGEGWQVNKDGSVVGITTGRPVLLLDDLLVALRSVTAAREVGISCSIEPTAEGRLALQAFLDKQTRFSRSVTKGIERAMGPQQVSLTGIPDDSHFARVLVAADYRMKRLAMDLERPPINGLPSFLDLLKKNRARPNNMTPRWWLACNYEPLARSEDGLSYELRGPGVKAMTEDDFITADGSVRRTGHKNPIAEQWAETMTAKYDELCAKDIVFGDLRNIMDMCVIAAVLEKEQLFDRAGCSVPLLTDSTSSLKVEKWHTAKTVSTQSSFMKIGNEYIITASGGVQVESWDVASHMEVSKQVEQVRARAKPNSPQSFWWN